MHKLFSAVLHIQKHPIIGKYSRTNREFVLRVATAAFFSASLFVFWFIPSHFSSVGTVPSLSHYPSGRTRMEPSTTASAPWTEAEEEEAGASDGPVQCGREVSHSTDQTERGTGSAGGVLPQQQQQHDLPRWAGAALLFRDSNRATQKQQVEQIDSLFKEAGEIWFLSTPYSQYYMEHKQSWMIIQQCRTYRQY